MKRCKYYCLAMTLVGFALFHGCSTKTVDTDVEVITVNPNEATEYVNISEIADSVQCIRLQTAPDDVLGRVLMIYVKKKYIYAMDVSQHMVFVFDKTGKYVAKLDKRGKAPDEYTNLGFVLIDDNEEYVEILNYRGASKSVKLKYANISFDFIESQPFPEMKGLWRKYNDRHYFAGHQGDATVDGKKTNAGLFIFNEKENKIKILFDKTIETNGNFHALYIESFAQNDKNELFMSIEYDNTFYRIEADTVYPEFVIDFGKYNMDNSMGMKSLSKQMQYEYDMTNKASFPVLSMNNSDIMAFSYYFKEENRTYKEEDYRQYVKLKKKNVVYHTKKFKNDITNFPDHMFIMSSNYVPYCGHDVWQGKYLVDVLFPEQYLLRHNKDKMFVEGIGEIDVEDNPIVILMKMKE